MPNTIQIHRVLCAAPEKVYRAFLDPERWRSGRDKKLEGRRKIARSSVIAAHLSNVSAADQSLQRFETPSLPTLTRSYPRHFTFYLAEPSAPFACRLC